MMLIGIMSDTHGNYENVTAALRIISQRGVDLVLHCGDIDDAETVRLFKGVETHFVFGNCDTDKTSLRKAIRAGRGTLHEPYGSLELAGRKIAWLHGDDPHLFRDVEHSEYYHYLFYGHSHQAEQHRSGRTLIVNPGALHRARVKTFVLLNLDNDELQSVAIE
jgi:putative phosphoesterase